MAIQQKEMSVPHLTNTVGFWHLRYEKTTEAAVPSGAEQSLWTNRAVGRPNDVSPGEMAKTRKGGVKDFPLRGLTERLPEHATNGTALRITPTRSRVFQ